MYKDKVTIGIPAFNEENNIGKLLKSILNKSAKIIVYSDGSTDKTIEVVESFKSKKIRLIKSPKRSGVGVAQNKIHKMATTEVLVILNADVLIKDRKFIEKLVKPIINDKSIGLTSAKVVPLKANGFIERTFEQSHKIKNKLYTNLGNDNIYQCHGRARALSKKLYKKLIYPNVIADDSYSYIFNKKIGLKFRYVRSAKIYFRSPQNIRDYLSQSQRFAKSKSELNNTYYKIPFNKYLYSVVDFMINHPISAFFYILILLVSKFLPNSQTYTWTVAKSSKKL